MDNPWNGGTWHRDRMNGDGMMGSADGSGWVATVALLLLVLLALALVAALTTLLVRGRTGHPGHPEDARHPDHDARRVLDGRLARGEVSPEDYQAVRTLLEGSPT